MTSDYNFRNAFKFTKSGYLVYFTLQEIHCYACCLSALAPNVREATLVCLGIRSETSWETKDVGGVDGMTSRRAKIENCTKQNLAIIWRCHILSLP